jgi:hypothetical protein
VYTSIIITLVPAILTVALRFYPKRIRKIKPWWDDWIALFALVCPFAVRCDNPRVYANGVISQVPAILYDAAAFFRTIPSSSHLRMTMMTDLDEK